MKEIIITDKTAGGRLDKILFKYLSAAPSGFIYKMLRKKNIVLNDKKAAGSEILNEGDVIKLYLSDETVLKFRSQDANQAASLKAEDTADKIKDFIIFEDENIIALNKPAGLLSQKAKQDDISLNDMLVSYLKGDEFFTPGIANRLDRNTSGIVLAAKNPAAARHLSEAVKNRYFDKIYLALCCGKIDKPAVLEGYLSRDENNNKSVIQDSVNGAKSGEKPVKTAYDPIISNGKYTLVEADLITGRSHQIRAQMAHAGFPLAGDFKYGNSALNKELKEKYGLKSQLLCACTVTFRQMTGPLEYLNGKTLKAPLPESFENVLKGENLWQPGLQEA